MDRAVLLNLAALARSVGIGVVCFSSFFPMLVSPTSAVSFVSSPIVLVIFALVGPTVITERLKRNRATRWFSYAWGVAAFGLFVLIAMVIPSYVQMGWGWMPLMFGTALMVGASVVLSGEEVG